MAALLEQSLTLQPKPFFRQLLARATKPGASDYDKQTLLKFIQWQALAAAEKPFPPLALTFEDAPPTGELAEVFGDLDLLYELARSPAFTLQTARALACTSRAFHFSGQTALKRWNLPPTPSRVYEYLLRLRGVPKGNDPVTQSQGLFEDMTCCLTAAHAKERSIEMVGRASGCSRVQAIEILRRWTPNKVDVLKQKPLRSAPSPKVLQPDLASCMTEVFGGALDADEDTLMTGCGWLPDLAAQVRAAGASLLAHPPSRSPTHARAPSQFGYNCTEINHQAMVNQNGVAGVLDRFGIARSDAPIGKTAHSFMLKATYKGEHCFFIDLRRDGRSVRKISAVIIAHGSGMGGGETAATVQADALGLARAAVGDMTMPEKIVNLEDFGL